MRTNKATAELSSIEPLRTEADVAGIVNADADADTKDARITASVLAFASPPTRPPSRVIDTPIHWTLDVPSSTPSESGIYSNAALRLGSGVNDGAEATPSAPIAQALQEVTLIVYGWTAVEPGTLAWVFPTVRAALGAARAMRNAVGWAILSGDQKSAAAVRFDIIAARERGDVLVEQPV